MIVSAKKTEVEGALPGRFFPSTQTTTLAHADKKGHFLRVTCGADRIPCPSFRDLLEQRLATWELTGAGQTVQQEAKRCRSGIWSELAPTLVGSSVWN